MIALPTSSNSGRLNATPVVSCSNSFRDRLKKLIFIRYSDIWPQMCGSIGRCQDHPWIIHWHKPSSIQIGKYLSYDREYRTAAVEAEPVRKHNEYGLDQGRLNCSKFRNAVGISTFNQAPEWIIIEDDRFAYKVPSIQKNIVLLAEFFKCFFTTAYFPRKKQLLFKAACICHFKKYIDGSCGGSFASTHEVFHPAVAG